jgi:hypothetical protein
VGPRTRVADEERRKIFLVPGFDIRPEDYEKSLSVILQNVGQTYFETEQCFTRPI